ncbi:hypothetical protein G7Y89_g3121 [Cudoniella acicularis]|uniref:Autophagy-related protein n=1 Tax=Cudoniella acicularis TaxID=354080 RepID=A0A8H4W8P8_9HELO|nr:hypothetical protein G7Y89_g3121 [Cudoniella acicularis]
MIGGRGKYCADPCSAAYRLPSLSGPCATDPRFPSRTASGPVNTIRNSQSSKPEPKYLNILLSSPIMSRNTFPMRDYLRKFLPSTHNYSGLHYLGTSASEFDITFANYPMTYGLLVGNRADFDEYAHSAYIPEFSPDPNPSSLTMSLINASGDQKHPDRSFVLSVIPASTEASEDENGNGKEDARKTKLARMGSKKALVAWLIVCYSVRFPFFLRRSVAASYVTAAIQSLTNLVGHVPDSKKACATKGVIKCVVNFGGHDVDYNSYLIYIQALARAMQDVTTILFSGATDFSNFRKYLMVGSILLYGILALPFAGITNQLYRDLVALSGLYVALDTVQGVYVVLESSYIPIFMRSVGWFKEPARIAGADSTSGNVEEAEKTAKHVFLKGTRVSVLGLLSGNFGALTGLLIGIVITYTRGSTTTAGYHNFLLSVTISSALTVCFAILGSFLLSSIPRLKVPPGSNLALVPVKRWFRLLKSITRYPEAFKLCIAWILWNTSYSNFLSLIALLFREVSGLSSGDGLYTVYSFLNVICACIGSLTFMFVFPYANFPVQR